MLQQISGNTERSSIDEEKMGKLAIHMRINELGLNTKQNHQNC
jgi:hypothetical protein